MQHISNYITRIKEFGLGFFFKYHVIGRIKGKRYKQSVVLDFVKKDLGNVNIEFKKGETHTNEGSDVQPIWVCWWQGEEQMPPIVNACYHSLLVNSNGHPVNLITKNNFSNYISLPPHIFSKLESHSISLTHFSDILRFALLSEYGGLWVDSTVFLTGKIPSVIPFFFTIHQECQDDNYVSDYRWTGYFIGGSKKNPLFTIIFSYYCNYWSKHNNIIDYYLMDYIIAAIMELSHNLCQMVDEVPMSNPDLQFLLSHMDCPFDNDTMTTICCQTNYHKLSWKGSHNTVDPKGHITYYGKLLESAK